MRERKRENNVMNSYTNLGMESCICILQGCDLMLYMHENQWVDLRLAKKLVNGQPQNFIHKLTLLAGNTIIVAISLDFDTSHVHELLFNSAGGIFLIELIVVALPVCIDISIHSTGTDRVRASCSLPLVNYDCGTLSKGEIASMDGLQYDKVDVKLNCKVLWNYEMNQSHNHKILRLLLLKHQFLKSPIFKLAITNPSVSNACKGHRLMSV
ncbi:hypothetical protein CFP56_037434 [Quercus suber]|uniref:Uncharacterized protein n=1 Tax=Quercus suber TaxID=58331 RepID=A0AAW0LP66_QUESU